MPDQDSFAGFHHALHRWYRTHGRRNLPWRNTEDPYAIWVSEVMLQQTQVATVLARYYHPFLARFPTVEALATASREAVLSAWQGLGYYNRAINLHEAAKRTGSALPETVEELIALPGIGRNTAHAVAAFAYRQPVPVMEANVKRVVSRIFVLSTPADNQLWEKAHALLNRQQPFDYNQAMMDIGALVCTPRKPDCPRCPANLVCKGQIAPESYPAPKKAKTTPVRQKKIILLQNTWGEFYATPHTTRFLQGLYHFVEIDEPQIMPYEKARLLGQVSQTYSHFRLEAEVYLVSAKDRGKDWYAPAALAKLPMSQAEKKMLQLLEQS